MLWFILLVGLLTICLLKVLVFLFNYVKLHYLLRNIPKLTSPHYPILGHALSLKGENSVFFRTIKDMCENQVLAKGHKMSVVWIGVKPVLLLLDPETAKSVLKSNVLINKADIVTRVLRAWLGDGLILSKDEKWRNRRKLLTPTFHFSILRDFLVIMNEQTEIFTGNIERFSDCGEPFNICPFIDHLALDIICETAMGKKVYAQRDMGSEYVTNVGRLAKMILQRQKNPLLASDWIYNQTKAGKEFSQLVQNVHEYTKSVINDKMKNANCNKSPGKKRLAFLDMLLTATDENNVSLNLEGIHEEADTFMFAGHDTTSNATAFALHLIGKHPNVQQKIHDEIDKVFKIEKDFKVTIDDLRKLEYLEAVIKESLRIFSPVPFIVRTIDKECTIDGHKIPRGIDCSIGLYFINRNPDYWINPTKFDPDRFLTKDGSTQHPYAYIPFSAGPRNCIGQKFAQMEEKLVLTQFFRKYRIIESLDDTENMPLSSGIVLTPTNGINIRIENR